MQVTPACAVHFMDLECADYHYHTLVMPQSKPCSQFTACVRATGFWRCRIQGDGVPGGRECSNAHPWEQCGGARWRGMDCITDIVCPTDSTIAAHQMTHEGELVGVRVSNCGCQSAMCTSVLVVLVCAAYPWSEWRLSRIGLGGRESTPGGMSTWRGFRQWELL